MDVIFYTLLKTAESTKLPLGDGVTVNCVLKDDCSIISPRLELDLGFTNPSGVNYAYIPDFSRYYFITNWIWEDRLWVAYLDVDVLASYRTNILNSYLYVLRSASASDGRILDAVYPARAEETLSTIAVDNPFPTSTAGIYIISTLNGSNDRKIGSCNYYALTYSQLGTLMEYLFTSSNYVVDFENFELSEELYKALINPSQYITSCIYIPATSIAGTLPQPLIGVGWWKLSISGARLCTSSTTTLDNITINNIPRHPQADARGIYLNGAPYSAYSLYFPPFGTFELDANAFININSIVCEINIDITNGEGTLVVHLGSAGGQVLITATAQVGVPLTVAQMARDMLAYTTGQVHASANFAREASHLSVTGTMESAADIFNNIHNAFPALSAHGSNGGYGGLIYKPAVLATFKHIVDEDNANNGRPLCEKRTLSTLTGYCKVMHGHVDITGTSEEADKIQNLLEAGFYIE